MDQRRIHCFLTLEFLTVRGRRTLPPFSLPLWGGTALATIRATLAVIFGSALLRGLALAFWHFLTNLAGFAGLGWPTKRSLEADPGVAGASLLEGFLVRLIALLG